jgi:hypothetical protein
MDDVSRFSRVAEGLHTFDCHQCGKIAATIELVDSDEPVNVGEGPTGEDMSFTLNLNGALTSISYTFIGVGVRSADTYVARIIGGTAPLDPISLAAIDWELGAFCCRHCQLNYCSTCWRALPVFATDHPSWYEQTDGTCPVGHPQKLDD